LLSIDHVVNKWIDRKNLVVIIQISVSGIVELVVTGSVAYFALARGFTHIRGDNLRGALRSISIHEQYFERKFVDFDLFVHEIEDKILIIWFLKMTL